MNDTQTEKQCPLCHIALQRNDRQGIEIDNCPQCRGVWLDRGELDKFIERAALEFGGPAAAWDDDSPAAAPPQSQPAPQQPQQPQQPQFQPMPLQIPQLIDLLMPRGYNDDDRNSRDPRHKKRKKNLIEELFGFD